MTKRSNRPRKGGDDVNLGGVLQGLGDFISLLSNLAEKGEILRSKVIEDEGKNAKAVYGFSVRLGGPGGPRVEPFGNVKVSAEGPVIDESREPLVDLFDEDDHILVLAELPGVEAKDIQFELRGDILDLSATHQDRRYRKEVTLPSAVDAGQAQASYRNGIYELKLPKARR